MMMKMMILLVEALILSNFILISVGDNYQMECSRIVGAAPPAASVLHDINLVLLSLTAQSSSSLFFNTSVPSSLQHQVFAMYQCMGDLTLTNCSKCISAAVKELHHECWNTTSARLKQGDSCILRYDQKPFFTLDTSPIFWSCHDNSTVNPTITTHLASVLASIVAQAPHNHNGYASLTVGDPHSSSQLSAFAQCFGYLSPSDCALCLRKASQSIDCPGFKGGSMYLESCYISYDTPVPTSSPSPLPPAPKTSLGSKSVPVTNPFLAVLFLFLATAIKW